MEAEKAKTAHDQAEMLEACVFLIKEDTMNTRWPFGGFFLKILDEQNGTHEYEDYRRECEENPLTEEEQQEREENGRAAMAEMEQANAEEEQKQRFDYPVTFDDSELANEPIAAKEDITEAHPEIEIVPTEAIVPLGQEPPPADEERWIYASELIGDAFQHWENGRVILDMGTGCGKNEFIIKRLVKWIFDENFFETYGKRVLYLCPLNALHTEMIRRRNEAEYAEADDESSELLMLYDVVWADILEIQTYQHLETLCRNNPAALEQYLKQFKYIAADECHYWSEFSSFNINTHYSLETLLQAEKDHTVIYMSATGCETWNLLEDKGGPTQPDHIYRLPQHYEYVKAAYFYARYNLVSILKSLPAGEKAVVFVELGDDLVEMEKIFGDTAAYYCSPYNENYKERFSDLSVCVKDGQLLKNILFATKALGVGIGLKDCTVKHIFIDQWNPLEIAQSLGRKRSLDANDTCTVYFRDYGLDWYWGTNSGLAKFRNMLLSKYQPAQAYMLGKEEFDKYLHSDAPEVIQKRIEKSKILEHNVVTGYHINPLGVRQISHDLEMLYDIMGSKNYPESFMKYAMFNLHQPIKEYRFKDLEKWLYAHLDQPMNPDEMTEKIMRFGYIEAYYDRTPGQTVLNHYLQGYGVKIKSDRNRKRGQNYQTIYWKLIEIKS